MTIKLLFTAGSAREASLNKKLAYAAYQNAKNQSGVDAIFLDLKAYPLPLFDEDLESAEGMPENAITLKKMFSDCDGFFIASPEYNSAYSPLLKNTIDWMSRVHEEGEKPLAAFKGKVAGLAAVSPGGLGGIRGLVPLRMLLGNIGVHVIPNQAAINNGMNAFDANENMADEKQEKMLETVIHQLIETTKSLKG